MSDVVSISEAKAQLSRLVARARDGETIVIGHHGRPVAVLGPFEASAEPRRLGGWSTAEVWIAPDFDDELSDDDFLGPESAAG